MAENRNSQKSAGTKTGVLKVGIDITVVTDKSFNTQDVSYEKRKAKQQRLNDAVEKLNARWAL